ncbi:MAG TPA: aminoglycoside phosphotransferase family protein [Drouetiella sp.]
MTQSNSDLPIINQVSQAHNFGALRSVKRFSDGVVNRVYLVSAKHGKFVARLNEDCLVTFKKEAWAIERASKFGVIAPKVFGVGEIGNTGYMVMEYVSGKNFSDVKRNRRKALNDFGRQTKLINSIEVGGFGFFLDWGDEITFKETWSETCEVQHKFIFGNSDLVQMGALTNEEQNRVIDFLAPMNDWKYPPMLCHGDVSTGNVIVKPDGTVVVIDWTQVKGGVAPYYDLAGLSEKLTDADFREFLQGYGMSPEEFAADRMNYRRIRLCDVARGASWAHQVKHSNPDRFIEEVRQVYHSIFG